MGAYSILEYFSLRQALKFFKPLAFAFFSVYVFASLSTPIFAQPQDNLADRPEVKRLYLALSEKLKALQVSTDAARLDNLIEKHQVFIEEVNVGRAEITKIDGIPIMRIIYQPTQDVLLYLPQELQDASEHLKKYVARQHMDAGAFRTDGQQGRDVVLVRADAEGNLIDVDYSPRPEKIGQWLTDWKDATYVPLTKGDKVLGFACGIVQGALALCISAANVHYGRDNSVDLHPAIVSFTFATVLGMYSGTLRNILQRGSTWWKMVKSALLTSASFAYTLKMWKDGASSVSPLEFQGLINHARIWLNILGNNYAKTFWYQLALTRTGVRSNIANWTFFLPGVKEPIIIKRQDVELNAAYLGPFTFKMIDFLTNSKIPWISELPYIGPVFTWSLGALIASGAVMQGVTVYHANRVGYDRAEQMARDFERQNPLGWIWRIYKRIRQGDGEWRTKKINPSIAAGCEVRLDPDSESPDSLSKK